MYIQINMNLVYFWGNRLMIAVSLYESREHNLQIILEF